MQAHERACEGSISSKKKHGAKVAKPSATVTAEEAAPMGDGIPVPEPLFGSGGGSKPGSPSPITSPPSTRVAPRAKLPQALSPTIAVSLPPDMVIQFWCKMCGKRYKKHIDLMKHELIHLQSNEAARKFCCSVCNKGFKRHSNLRQHEKTSLHLGNLARLRHRQHGEEEAGGQGSQ